MNLTVTIDNANAVATAVDTAYNAKRTEVIDSLIATGYEQAAAETEADMQLAPLNNLLNSVFFQKTKCVLTFDADNNVASMVINTGSPS